MIILNECFSNHIRRYPAAQSGICCIKIGDQLYFEKEKSVNKNGGAILVFTQGDEDINSSNFSCLCCWGRCTGITEMLFTMLNWSNKHHTKDSTSSRAKPYSRPGFSWFGCLPRLFSHHQYPGRWRYSNS